MPEYKEIKSSNHQNFNIDKFVAFKREAKNAISDLESARTLFPYSAKSVFDEMIQEIQKNTKLGLQKFEKDSKFIDFFVERIKSMCSMAVNAYQAKGNSLYLEINKDSDFLIGKTTKNEIFSPKANLVNNLMREFGVEARFDNSVLLGYSYSGPNSYIIFPKNGFKFTWRAGYSLSPEHLPISEFYFHDHTKKIQAINRLNEITDLYRGIHSDVYFSEPFFRKFMLSLESRSKGGEIDKSVLDLFSNKALITKESFFNNLKLKTDDFLNYYSKNILVSGTFFAISYKYRDYIFDKLEIGT